MIPNYVVLEVVLDERFVGKGSKNLPDLKLSSMNSVLKATVYTQLPLKMVAVKDLVLEGA